MAAVVEASRGERDNQDQELVQRALTRDPAAVAALVRRMAPVVHVRVARALSRRRVEARGRDLRADMEDMVQEVFAALFESDGRALRAWHPERGLSLENFVGLLAEREVVSILRSGRRNPWTEDPTLDTTLNELDTDQQSSAEGRVASRQRLDQLMDRLRERLSPLGLHYFRLLFVEERGVAEVAEETSSTTDALYAWRSRLGRLVKQLARELDDEEEVSDE